MPRPIDDIIAELYAFSPTTHDYNYEGRKQLGDLTRELLETDDAELAIPVLLNILEQFPDADLGTPGAIVHTLEAIPGYEPFLLDSVRKQPSPYSIEMIHRLINGTDHLKTKRELLHLMQDVLHHPQAPASARQQAATLIDWHRSEGLDLD